MRQVLHYRIKIHQFPGNQPLFRQKKIFNLCPVNYFDSKFSIFLKTKSTFRFIKIVGTERNLETCQSTMHFRGILKNSFSRGIFELLNWVSGACFIFCSGFFGIFSPGKIFPGNLSPLKVQFHYKSKTDRLNYLLVFSSDQRPIYGDFHVFSWRKLNISTFSNYKHISLDR